MTIGKNFQFLTNDKTRGLQLPHFGLSDPKTLPPLSQVLISFLVFITFPSTYVPATLRTQTLGM